MTYISRHSFTLSQGFTQLTREQYETVRSRPGHPIKNRETMTELETDETAAEVRVLRSREENIRRHILDASQTVKIVGYNDEPGVVASAGSSQVNTLCLTDGTGPCIAVAIGAENLSEGVPAPGANARIFHVFAFDDNKGEFLDPIARHIEKMRARGLTVKAAMHGGDADSIADARMLRRFFQEQEIELHFDETCELREGKSTCLGAVVRPDHTVQFVTELAVVSEQAPDPSDRSHSDVEAADEQMPAREDGGSRKRHADDDPCDAAINRPKRPMLSEGHAAAPSHPASAPADPAPAAESPPR